MSAGDKYSVKVSDQQIQEYKETFLMFDKAGRQGATIQGLSGFTLRTEMGLSLPRSWGRYSGPSVATQHQRRLRTWLM